MDAKSNQTTSKVIPGIKSSSCQLIVFVFYNGKFKIKLNNLQDHNTNTLNIQLQSSGLTYNTPVK